MPISPVDIASRLQRLRGLADISARELDRVAEITQGHTTRIESGGHEHLEARTVARLAAALGTTMDWLFHGEGREPSAASVRRAVECARKRLGLESPKTGTDDG